MEATKTVRLVRCGLFTALVAIGAFIQIPVPYMDYFTLQFLFVILAGMLLGSADGAAAVGAYVLIGLAGVPVFAAGGGLQYIFRPSFGYLLGFVAAAYVAGKAVERKHPSGVGEYFICALAAFAVTYGIGLLYKYLMLNLYVGEATPFWIVVASCFPLDIPGDLVLCGVGSVLARQLRPALRRIGYGC